MLSAGAVLGLLAAGTARASTVNGSIWEYGSAQAPNATPGNVPSTTPNVTFTASSPLNMNSNGASGGATYYTIGSFLGTNPGGYTVLTGASQLGNSLDNTLFNFTGDVTVTNGETFTATHDDGMTLVIDGTYVINSPDPTSADTVTYTWTGNSGTYAFQLVYDEVDGAPAVLQVALPLSSTPEPSSMLLLGTGLLGMGGLLRRKMNQSA